MKYDLPVLGLAAMAFVSLAGCDCIPRSEPVALIDGADFFGYELSGPYGFEGTLSKPEPGAAEWQFEGTLVFNTGGYLVREPDVLVRESFPEQVSITVEVVPPGPFDPVPQVITMIDVAASVYASDEADFDIEIVTVCPGLL